MKKHRDVWIIEVVLVIVLIGISLVQLRHDGSFWKLSLADILDIFFTASLGILGMYITLKIVENNTWKRRRTDYVIEQLRELIALFEGRTLKLQGFGNYPPKELFTSTVQKAGDYIEVVNILIDLNVDKNGHFQTLKDKYYDFSKVLDYYDHSSAVDSNVHKINQCREDCIHAARLLISNIYKSNN